jgi:methanogenic corrinoid protein MtbC1
MRVVIDEGLNRGVPVAELYLGVIKEAQRRIGDLWQLNQISVAQEHLATAIARLAMTHLYSAMPLGRPVGRRVIVACVEGEQHDLGPRVVADFFEMAGFDVRYLGASVPTDSLLAMVLRDVPDLVVLSVTMAFHLDALRSTVAQLRQRAGDRVRVAVGGNAFAWASGVAEELKVDVFGRDALETVGNARRLFGVDS